MAKLIRTDRNGTKYYEGYINCTRCDGKGVYIIGVCNGQPVLSPVDNGVCFKCGGSGKQMGKWKEYTPEYEAKLAERREKRRAKQLAEHAEEIAQQERERQEREEAERRELEARLKAEREAQEKEEERKAKSQYIGTVGEKVEIEARYIGSPHYERPAFGYGTETAYIHTFRIGDNTVVWNTTSCKGLWDVEEGDIVRMTATIKDHKEYKGEKQTILIRCNVKQTIKKLGA